MYGTHLSPVLGNTEKQQTVVREYPEASGEKLETDKMPLNLRETTEPPP